MEEFTHNFMKLVEANFNDSSYDEYSNEFGIEPVLIDFYTSTSKKVVDVDLIHTTGYMTQEATYMMCHLLGSDVNSPLHQSLVDINNASASNVLKIMKMIPVPLILQKLVQIITKLLPTLHSILALPMKQGIVLIRLIFPTIKIK